MVIRRIRIVIFFLLAFLLQGNAVHYFSINGGVPDLILVLTLVYTFVDDADPRDALIVAAAAGLLKDLCYSQITGISSLLYLAAGLLMIYLKRRLNNESRIIFFFVTVMATVLFYGGQCFLFILFTQTVPDLVKEALSLPGAVFWNYLILLLISNVIIKRRRSSRYKY